MGAAAAAAFAIGESFEGAFHTIEQATGATGSALTGLEDSFKNVLASTPGADMKNVAAAIDEVSVRTHLTGAALEEFAAKEIELGKITKTDVGANVQATTALFNQFGIAAGDQASKLDVLFKASQIAGVSITAIDDAMKSAAPMAQTLGLTFDQTAALTANLTAMGLPVTKVMMGLGSEFAKVAKAGGDPIDVIRKMTEAIKAAPDATTATTIAVKDFGIGARQAATLVDGLRSGALDLGDTLAKITSGSGGIDETTQSTLSLGDKMEMLKNKTLVALAPIGEAAVGVANSLVDMLFPALDMVGSVFSEIAGLASAFFEAFKAGDGDITSSGLAGWFEQLGLDVRTAFDEVMTAWDDIVGGFQNPEAEVAVGGLTGTLIQFGQMARNVFDTVTGAWDEFTAGFSGDAGSGPFAQLGEVIRTVVDFIQANAEPILLSFAGVFATVAAGGAISIVAGAIGSIVTVLGVLVGALASPVVLIGALVAALVVAYQNSETFRDVVQTVADALLSFGQAAIPVIIDGFDRFKQGITIVVDKVSEFVDYFRENVAPVIVPVLDHIGSSIADFARFFIDRWQAIQDTVTIIVQGLIAAIVIPIGIVVETAMFIWDHFGEQIVAVLTFAWNEVSAVLDAAVRIVGDVFDFITSIITGNWGQAWDAVLDIFDAAWGLIQDTFGNLLSFVVDFFSSLPGNILSALGDIASALEPFAASALEFFASIPGRILSVLGDLGGDLIGWMGSALSSLAASLPGALTAVADFFIALPFTLLGLLVSADVWLVETGISVLRGLGSGILDFFFNSLVPWFEGLPGALLGFFTNAVSWLYNAGWDILAGISNGILAVWGNITAWFTSLPGMVVDAIGDTLSWLYDAGSNIINGLKNGIVDAAKNVAGTIYDAAKDALGPLGGLIPSSPVKDPNSPLFRFNDGAPGKWMMQQIADGITDNANAPYDALAALGTFQPPGVSGLPGSEQIGAPSPVADTTHALLRELIDAVKKQEMAVHLKTEGAPGAPITPTDPVQALRTQQTQVVR